MQPHYYETEAEAINDYEYYKLVPQMYSVSKPTQVSMQDGSLMWVLYIRTWSLD